LYEKHHRVVITDAAIQSAAVLSDRYVSDRALPDKAIDLIDEASARVRMKLTTTPEDLKELQKEIRKQRAEQDDSVNKQDFEAAAGVREKVKKLQDKLALKEAAWRDKLGETVPGVGEEDTAQTVAARAGGVSLRFRRRADQARHVGVHGAAHDRSVGRLAPWLRRVRRGRSAHRGCAAKALLGDSFRRDREGAPRGLQHAAADPRGRAPE